MLSEKKTANSNRWLFLSIVAL